MINVNEMKPRQRSNSNKVRDDVFTEENFTILEKSNNLAIVENGELTNGSQEKQQNQENHVVDLIEISNKNSSINSVETFKRKKINQIKESQKKTKMRDNFVEWSLLTKFDGYSKIFDYEKPYSKLIWIGLFLAFSSATLWLVSTNFIDFFDYEIVTQTEIINERPMEFPTVTICNSNPFTTTKAQSLIKNVSLNWLNTNIDILNFPDSLKQMPIAIEMTKMFAASHLYTDEMRKELGFSLINNAFQFSFNGQDLNKTQFHWYYSSDYVNCFQFNSGFNQ